jgi:N-carbamoylputrescine amidase
MPRRSESVKAGGIMPRKLIGGLIQAAAPITDSSRPIDKIRKAAIDARIPLNEEAGQVPHSYDIAEAVPGPTTELMAQYAKMYQMAMVVPVYERRVYGSSYLVDPRGNFIAVGSEDKDELIVPETYGSTAEQLP